MKPLDLVGLKADSPMGAMAAFGLLRILDCYCTQHNLSTPRLGWCEKGNHAQLYLPDEKDKAFLEECLQWSVGFRLSSPVMKLKPDLKVTQDDYRAFALEHQKEGDNDSLAFLAAFGNELIMSRRKDAIEITPLSMCSGQQRFLLEVRNTVSSMRDNHVMHTKVEEALLQPWCYLDSDHMLGWNPASEREHAYQPKKPSDQKPKGVMLAIWLAFESLPLFPTMAVSRRLSTGSFIFRDKEQHMIWPVWDSPLTLATIETLLAQLAGIKDILDLRKLGVTSINTSRRMRTGKNGVYGIFKSSYMEGLR